MKSKDRVLILGPLPPPIHGVSMVNKMIVDSNLLADKFFLTVVPFNFSKSIEDIGFISWKKIIEYFNVLFKLILTLARLRFKVVYFSISPIGKAFIRDSIFVLVIRLFRVKYILHIHGLGIKECYQSSSLIVRYLYRTVFGTGHVIILSDTHKYDVDFLSPQSIRVVPNGVSFELRMIEKSLPDGSGNFTLLFFSNLVISKGVLLVVEAFEILQMRYNAPLQLRIVGADGDISAHMLRQMIALKGLKNVAIDKPAFGVAKEKIFYQSDLFIYPTMLDYFPLVLLEAMHAGLPIISTDTGAIREILGINMQSEPSGLLLENKTAQALAESIWSLYNNPALAIRFSESGKKKAIELYSKHAFEQSIFDVLTQIISSND